MQINRHNYEEYFILYMDNELSTSERRMVEDFVLLHPDLREELEILLQSRFTPDTSVVFDDKHELLFDRNSPVNLSNYEEWLLLYTDNELDTAQRAAVEQLAASNPEVKRAMDQLSFTKLQPETIVFADKASLYRKEEKVRYFAWRRLSVAAVLLLVAGTTAVLVITNQPSGTSDPFVSTIPGAQETNTENIAAKKPGLKNDPIVDSGNDSPAGDRITGMAANANATRPGKKDPVKVAGKESSSDPAYANTKVKEPSNNLPDPDQNPNVLTSADINQRQLDKVNTPLRDDLTKSPGMTPSFAVTKGTIPPSVEIEDDTEPDGKKNKLRGFFRKVTRTFEKRTNIETTDDDDRLLVGGLAIRLK